jgi:hypothetical protein
LDSDDLRSPDKLEKQINFVNKNGYFDFTKIDEKSNPLNVYVTGSDVVTKRKMYNYGFPGCLTFMNSAKTLGLVQIKDIKKTTIMFILLKLCKKADCYLMKENLAQYRIRKKSISHDKLSKKLRSRYDLFHYCDEKTASIAFLYAC